MGVLLVQPKGGYLDRIGVQLPLGLLYIATYLRQKGVKGVAIYDQRIENKKRFFSLLKDIDILGITCLVGEQVGYALKIAALARKKKPSIKIVFGGVHPSLVPQQLIDTGLIDYVLVGEGEEQMYNLVVGKEMLPARQAIDVKDIPIPDYELLDMNKYSATSYEGEKSYSIQTSRGCPFKCGYCYNYEFNRSQWRPFPLDKVMANVDRLVKVYNAKTLYFIDDNVCVDLGRFKKMVKMIMDKYDVNMAFQGLRISDMLKFDDETYQLLKDAGVKSFDIGVETLNPKTLKLISKELNAKMILKALEKVKDKGFNLKFNFLAGLPGQSSKEMAEDITIARKLEKEHPRSYVVYNIYVPYPGTPLYPKALKEGFKNPTRFEEWKYFHDTRWMWKYSWLDKKTIKLLENTRFLFMLSNKNILSKVSNPITKMLFKIYQPIASFRINTGFYLGLSLEKKLAGY